MSPQAHDATFPMPLRWLLVPAAVWSAIAAAAIVLKRHAQEPTVARMSDEWLHSHTYDRRGEY